VSTPANNRGRGQSGRSATRALRVLVILALAGSLVALRVSRRGPATAVPSEAPLASESVGGQPEGQGPGEPSGEALDAQASQMRLESLSSQGQAGAAESTVQPASESAGVEPEGQRAGGTSGEALAAQASRTKRASLSKHGPAGIEPSSVQPGSESVGNQPAGLQPGEPSEAALEARAQQMKLAEIHSAFAADQSMLRNYLRDPDPTIGAAAFDALGVRNQGAAVAALLDVVSDPAEPVRLQALQLLLGSADLSEATRAATLRAALADPDPAFAAAATQALGGLKIDPAADSATLVNHLRDADPVVGAAAFDALGVRSKDGAVAALLDVVSDPAEPVRLQALQLLLGSPEVGEAVLAATLRAALADPDPAFVARAVQELGGREDAEALSALAEALGAENVSTRLLIVQSIANNSSAAPLLYQSRGDPDETVRSAATAILVRSNKADLESVAGP